MESSVNTNYENMDRLESRLINLEQNNQNLSQRLNRLETDLKNQQILIDKLTINKNISH